MLVDNQPLLKQFNSQSFVEPPATKKQGSLELPSSFAAQNLDPLNPANMQRYSSFVHDVDGENLLGQKLSKNVNANSDKKDSDCFKQMEDLTEVMSARLEAATLGNDDDQEILNSIVAENAKDLLLDDLNDDNDMEQVKVDDMLLNDDDGAAKLIDTHD